CRKASSRRSSVLGRADHRPGDLGQRAALVPGLAAQPLEGLAGGEAVAADQHPLGLFDHHPRVERDLELAGQLAALGGLHGVQDEQGDQLGDADDRLLLALGPGVRLTGEHRHHPDRVVAVGDGAGQHGQQPTGGGGGGDRRPALVGGQVAGRDRLLVLEGVDAGAFAVGGLELLQQGRPGVGDGQVAHRLGTVDQHQGGPVDPEQGVGGGHHPLEGLLDRDRGRPEVGQLVECLPQPRRRDRHRTQSAVTPSSDRRRMTPWSSGSRAAGSSTRSSDSSSRALAWASGSWAALPGSSASEPARLSTCSGLGWAGSRIGGAPGAGGSWTPDSLASSASTRSAGAPKWSRAPPKATEQTTNQPKPRAAPPITSVSQWTPSSTREAATATVIRAAPAASQAFTRRGRPRPTTSTTAAQVAAAAAGWPGGEEKPLAEARWGTGGRARSTSSLTVLAIRFWPTTTVTRKASTARRRRSTHSSTPRATVTDSTVTVAPSQVIRPSTRVENGVALSAPQAAALASQRYRPVWEGTISEN